VLTIHIDDQGAALTLRGIADRASAPAVLRVLGEVRRRQTQEVFEAEGWPPGSWRRLHSSTLAAAFTRGNEARKNKRKLTRPDGRITAGFRRFAFGGKKILAGLEKYVGYKVTGNRLLQGFTSFIGDVQHLGATIRPKNKKALRFPSGGGGFIFAKRVVIPARPVLVIRPQDPAELVEAAEAWVAGAK